MNLSRRLFLHSGLATGAALAVAPNVFAEPTLPGWHVGYANAPAAGYPQAAMTLVKGKAPAGLAGTLYRNGPAHFKHGDAYATHWFDGDGMVQRIAIGDGKAMHSGKFVDTPKRRQEMAAGKFLAPGFGTVGDPSYPVMSADDVNPGNISVMMSGGELLALWEAGSPYRMDPVTLETKGLKAFRDDLKGMPFLAHPKREPDGRVWSLAMNGRRVGIYNINPDGTAAGFGMVDIGAAHYMHDWTMTERKLVILCQPWIQTKRAPSISSSTRTICRRRAGRRGRRAPSTIPVQRGRKATARSASMRPSIRNRCSARAAGRMKSAASIRATPSPRSSPWRSSRLRRAARPAM